MPARPMLSDVIPAGARVPDVAHPARGRRATGTDTYELAS